MNDLVGKIVSFAPAEDAKPVLGLIRMAWWNSPYKKDGQDWPRFLISDQAGKLHSVASCYCTVLEEAK